MMAARQSSDARCRQRQAMAALTELGMSFRGSLRCYPSTERRTERFLATPTTVASTPARSRSWRRWQEMAKGPHLRLVWLSENVDEVREVLVELWVGWCWLWCSGELT